MIHYEPLNHLNQGSMKIANLFSIFKISLLPTIAPLYPKVAKYYFFVEESWRRNKNERWQQHQQQQEKKKVHLLVPKRKTTSRELVLNARRKSNLQSMQEEHYQNLISQNHHWESFDHKNASKEYCFMEECFRLSARGWRWGLSRGMLLHSPIPPIWVPLFFFFLQKIIPTKTK